MTSKKKSSEKSPIKEFAMLMIIPVAIILVAVVFTQVPRLLANPQHDFIYSVCDGYRCTNSFTVSKDGFVTEGQSSNTSDYNYSYDYTTRSLYYYDISDDSTRKVSLEEAQEYRLDSSSRSPDGYKLSNNQNGRDYFLFWGGGSSEWELVNGSKKKNVSLISTRDYYYEKTNHVGWILND